MKGAAVARETGIALAFLTPALACFAYAWWLVLTA